MHRLRVITSYFNPAGFCSRLANYRVFRERLSVPLLTVELSFDGSFALVHLYGHRVNLLQDMMPEDVSVEEETPSAIYKLTCGQATDDDFRCAGAPLQSRSTVGLAWASPRAVLERHGLYDACVLGSADRAIVGAALGRFDFSIDALKMTGRKADHFLAWARPYHETVQGRVSYIPGRGFHLWHGELCDRRYEQRLDALRQYAFDPYTDIAVDDNGLWRWSSDKPELHHYKEHGLYGHLYALSARQKKPVPAKAGTDHSQF